MLLRPLKPSSVVTCLLELTNISPHPFLLLSSLKRPHKIRVLQAKHNYQFPSTFGRKVLGTGEPCLKLHTTHTCAAMLFSTQQERNVRLLFLQGPLQPCRQELLCHPSLGLQRSFEYLSAMSSLQRILLSNKGSCLTQVGC